MRALLIGVVLYGIIAIPLMVFVGRWLKERVR